MLGRGSTLLDVARWAWHAQIQLKLDSAHPLGCSHHQKIVVVDDRIAVCGGIDMTSERWDTREHRDPDARRRRPNGSRYGPWHDVTMMVEGEAAAALGELARSRWEVAGGDALERCPPVAASPWPEALDAEFAAVRVGIARTRAAYGDCAEVREIEELFVEQILRARRFIYIENQYFTSRRIAEAIVRRLAGRRPPEIVLVSSAGSDGWLEQVAMDGTRARLVRAIGAEDRRKRFAVYVPHTTRGQSIYVHAKLLIVDDELIRVGSANMNNRSLGLDSECDLTIEATGRNKRATGAAIRLIRHSLLAEHCGLTLRQVGLRLDKLGSMHRLIEGISGPRRRLRRLELPTMSDAEKVLADSAVLDPEAVTDLIEPFATPGLFARSRILRKPR
jgi:phosphatidylserine/phosphatidylglycerophosphate/cardiolipin synthase-like enzyme